MATGRRSNYIQIVVNKIGNAVKKAARNREKGWYNPHMAAASRAIAERILLVDFILEVRDARIPLSSECQQLRDYGDSTRRIIAMNKMDLANRSQLTEWINYFEQRNCISYGVNSHNKDSVKEFLNVLQTQVRELKKANHSAYPTTIMIVGIPNVGKSALATSLHQIGRISAAEKGRLKHATVSPHPGETKDISYLKIGSHPNIYVLDTPGILPPEILDVEVCAKLAITGAIRDCLVGEKELARYFLAILILSDEYKKWARFSMYENDGSFINHKAEGSIGSELNMRQKKKYLTDHTQDFIVHDVRRALFESIACFDGNMQNEKDLEELIEVQFKVLKEAFQVSGGLDDDAYRKVASKLLNLYRTGRLGHYTLDLPAS